MGSSILKRREAAKEKLEDAKKAMQENTAVIYQGNKYKIQALRLYHSQALGGVVYQAELVEETPLKWDKVLIVSLSEITLLQDNR